MSRNQDNICADCNHCFPDKDGPTSYGICLLDPELEPFEEEILELNFRNCRELVKKKRFDLNHEACFCTCGLWSTCRAKRKMGKLQGMENKLVSREKLTKRIDCPKIPKQGKRIKLLRLQ